MKKDILDFLSEFSSFLQNRGIAASESALNHLLKSLETTRIDVTNENEILTVLSVCLAKNREQVEIIKTLFQEFLFLKSISQEEEQKEIEKQNRKKALNRFLSDSQRQLEDLKERKEQIRQNVLLKAQDMGFQKKLSKKMQIQFTKLEAVKMTTSNSKQISQAQKLLSGEVPWNEKEALNVGHAMMKWAKECLYDGHFELADAVMEINKELTNSVIKQQKRMTALEHTIEEAQKETEQQIKELQRKICDEQQRYQNTCRELDLAFERMKKESLISNDFLTEKPFSTIHRADFWGGGSIQTMNADFIRISEKPFKQLTAAEKNQIRNYLRQNLLAFKTRMTRNINSQKRMTLSIEETMREAVRTCGQPMRLVCKQPKRNKANLILILDVSGSCKAASELMLTFIGILKEIFPRGCSAFAFVNSLYNISRVYETENIENAAKQILDRIPRIGQYSNYERPLKSMWEKYRNCISKDSIVIFIGDARNNQNGTGEEYIKNICRKAKHAYWLNTDVRSKWNQGDSIASVYGQYATMFETGNIKQLLGFISQMR